MGKKAKLYLLILVNLIAWGYVGYKVYNALQGDDETVLSYETSNIKKIDESVNQDSIVLSLNYPDPFLKNGNFSNERHNHIQTSTNNTSIKKSNTAPVKSIITPTVQPTLDIKYLGLVKNNTSGAQTALLSINGKSIFVKTNDNIDGLIIKQITNESILILKGKEKLTIRK